MDLERQERELRTQLESKRIEFDGEQILKGDAVEYRSFVSNASHIQALRSSRDFSCDFSPDAHSCFDLSF